MATKYATLKDSNGDTIYPQINTDSILDGSIAGGKMDWVTSAVTLTRATTTIGTTGSTHCKKFGKLVLLNLNFSTSASTSGNIYTGAPSPVSRLTISIGGGDNKAYRLFVNTDGSIQTDGTIPTGLWLSGCVMYFAA